MALNILKHMSQKKKPLKIPKRLRLTETLPHDFLTEMVTDGPTLGVRFADEKGTKPKHPLSFLVDYRQKSSYVQS